MLEFQTEKIDGVHRYEEEGHVSWQIGGLRDHHCHLTLGAVVRVLFSTEPVSCQGDALNCTVWFLSLGPCGKPARASSTCLVSVTRNRYLVPCELAGQMVSTRLYPGSVVVVADDAVVARHERMSDSGGTRYDWQHYISLVQRKPGALRNGAPFADMPEALQRLLPWSAAPGRRGPRLAHMLAIVPTAGLDAVIVAVELAMENGPPSGRVSVVHVVNVLGPLNAPATHQALRRRCRSPTAAGQHGALRHPAGRTFQASRRLLLACGCSSRAAADRSASVTN